jgi:hypothetical protein
MFAVQHGQVRGGGEATEKGNNQEENAGGKVVIDGNSH